MRIVRKGDHLVLAVRRVQATEACIALTTAGLLIYLLALLSRGWLLIAGIVVVIAGGLLFAARAFRIRIDATPDGLEVRNYWRTFRFGWAEVRDVGLGTITQGPLPQPALAFGLLNGKIVCAQATPRNRRELSKLTTALASLAPTSVVWRPDLIPA